MMTILLAGTRTAILIGLIVIFTNCSTRHSPVSAITPKVAPEISRASNTMLAKGRIPELTSITNQYVIDDTSRISVDDDSTKTLEIRANTVYSIAITRSKDSLRFQARANLITVESHSLVAKTVMDTNTSNHFVGTLTANGRVSKLTNFGSTTCVGGIDPTATRIYELTMTLPTQPMKIGDTWTDTVSTTTCRGKTPLIQESVRHFELINITTENQNRRVQIQRSVSTVFNGLSPDSKNYLSITGVGNATASIYLDSKNGVLLQSNGTSRTVLRITTGRGVFPFIQNTITHIKLQ